jgi:hypothetical protein
MKFHIFVLENNGLSPLILMSLFLALQFLPFLFSVLLRGSCQITREDRVLQVASFILKVFQKGKLRQKYKPKILSQISKEKSQA